MSFFNMSTARLIPTPRRNWSFDQLLSAKQLVKSERRARHIKLAIGGAFLVAGGITSAKNIAQVIHSIRAASLPKPCALGINPDEYQ